MAATHGQFMWYTLNTPDTKRARDFYTHVIGWGTQDLNRPGGTYTVFEANGAGVGGMMELDSAEAAAHGIPPHWIGYVLVDSVDETAASIKADGGTIHHAPDIIPGIGRFAAVADPQGASFIIFRPDPGGTRPEVAAGTPGHAGWHELHAADWEKVFPFYAKQFGWRKTHAHDMGPMGVYQLFSTGGQNAGGPDAGGVYNKQPGVPAPFWLFYFNVPDINQAKDRVLQSGGAIVNGPHEVPGGSWIVQCTDPQGAMFALVSPPA